MKNNDEDYKVEKLSNFETTRTAATKKYDGTGLAPRMTYGPQSIGYLRTSESPIKDVSTSRLSSRNEARGARIDKVVELRGGGNSQTPKLCSGAYDQEALSKKKAKYKETQ